MTGAAGRIGRRDLLRLGAAAAALAAAPRVALAQQHRRGGVLKHIGLEPPTFDIHAEASYRSQLVSSLVRRQLFKFVNGAKFGPSDFTPVPDLALKAERSTDGKMYTITLRPGVRWELRAPVNGRELVAADVKYSLERALRKSWYASLLGPVEGIETPDKRTVRIHLADAFAPLVRSLAEPWSAILPPEVEDKLGGFKSAESLIGCGPFVLERYEPGAKLVFGRNPRYYDRPLPYVDKVEWLFIRDRSTQLSLFRAGQVDIPFYDGRIRRSDVAALKKSKPAYPTMYWDGLANRSLALRTDKTPFSDVRVRRALSMALDRKKWVSESFDGQGFEDDGCVPAAMREWKLPARELGEGARYLEHDPALAKQLLAEAGFPSGMKIKCTAWAGYDAEYVGDLELLGAHLRQVGVELQIVSEEPDHYLRRSFLGKFDDSSWGPSSAFSEVDGYLYTFYRSGQPGNRSHVADTELDALLEAQRRSPSRAARKKVIDDIQRLTAARVYYVYTPSPRNVSSWTPRVKNYGPKNSADRGAQLEVVWLDGV